MWRHAPTIDPKDPCMQQWPHDAFETLRSRNNPPSCCLSAVGHHSWLGNLNLGSGHRYNKWTPPAVKWNTKPLVWMCPSSPNMQKNESKMLSMTCWWIAQVACSFPIQSLGNTTNKSNELTFWMICHSCPMSHLVWCCPYSVFLQLMDCKSAKVMSIPIGWLQATSWYVVRRRLAAFIVLLLYSEFLIEITLDGREDEGRRAFRRKGYRSIRWCNWLSHGIRLCLCILLPETHLSDSGLIVDFPNNIAQNAA